MTDFSDYIVFADESGDHGLKTINEQFPVFCLDFCVFEKRQYANVIVPGFQKFKFDFWGHDAAVLHEREIRKTTGDFAFLRRDPVVREKFHTALAGLISTAEFGIYASVILKKELLKRYSNPWNPYEISLLFCMESLFVFLHKNGQANKKITIVFESRGKLEDRELEAEFDSICLNKQRWGYKRFDFRTIEFEFKILPKSANSIGLQLADLTARPIANSVLHPKQANRAMEIIETKLKGLKCFP